MRFMFIHYRVHHRKSDLFYPSFMVLERRYIRAHVVSLESPLSWMVVGISRRSAMHLLYECYKENERVALKVCLYVRKVNKDRVKILKYLHGMIFLTSTLFLRIRNVRALVKIYTLCVLYVMRRRTKPTIRSDDIPQRAWKKRENSRRIKIWIKIVKV